MFKKRSWEVPYMPGATLQQSGYASEHFGIHKQCENWCVTHLRTGLAVDFFRAKRLSLVKQIVRRAEEKFDWSTGNDVYEIAAHNGIDARAFHDAVREIGRGA
ncbi:hypothetical protein [Rhizobium phaseoli]|uniref:hypothetical protein n=1 Tax=Rhizobium phaseoli TaxID=396 RepID=UPI002554DDAF|nr:hypothetical protein [Rhizobium phaseoli]MDK4729359.1 hypothetical protein [Rhizobium phaseoli]